MKETHYINNKSVYLYQYDKGQVLILPEELDITEVQFEDGSVMVVNKGKITIPDDLLCKAGRHYAWFQTIGSNHETTMQQIEFVVIPREQKNYGIGPEEAPTFREQIESIMNETKDIAESVRRDADDGLFDGEKGEKRR